MAESVFEILPDNIPSELKDLKQWIVWKLEKKADNSKPTKVPYYSLKRKAASNKPNTWLTFDNAYKLYMEKGFDGIGFMFTESDNFVGVDIDKCINDAGELNSVASDILNQLPSYAEYSPSGTGLHIIAKSDYKGAGRKDEATGVEVYAHGRFFTFTGQLQKDSPVIQLNDELEAVIEKYFPKQEVAQTTFDSIESGYSDKTDDEVLEAMFSCDKAAYDFGEEHGERLKRLYDDGVEDGEDHSSEDMYFVGQLAYFCNCDVEQMDRIFRGSAMYRDKWDRVHHSSGETYGQRTIANAVTSRKKNTIVQDSYLMPSGYYSQYGSLYKIVKKVKRGQVDEQGVFICRQTPFINRSFMNIEHPQLYHEIVWVDNGKPCSAIVPAGDLAIKKELLRLSYKSLAVTDNNARELIQYFDCLNMNNRNERERLVERLGHIKDTFIHPLIDMDVLILPPDEGDRQMLEAFQVSGTLDDWLENVLKPIQKHPKALLMLLASFTSVILKDLKLQPFIVDLAGQTSKGKTTVLRACASVWGNEELMNEWNITKVAAERKASFLNNFPLMLDDSRKADARQLQAFVYNFSSGRAKGRGSLTGSQYEKTWSSILLSTGEASLVDYAEQAGGVAARIITINGDPFEEVEFTFFNELYDSVDSYYGTAGLAFVEQWQAMKDVYIHRFKQLNELYQQEAQGNEVVSRIARYYAAIAFTGLLLNEFFECNIDLEKIKSLFGELLGENKAIDKPKHLLETMLLDLDANRDSVYRGHYNGGRTVKAIYKDGDIFITPSYLKEFLGVEEKNTRSEWLKRGFSHRFMNRGKAVDYKQIKIAGKKFNGVALKREIVNELGIDFSIEEEEVSDTANFD